MNRRANTVFIHYFFKIIVYVALAIAGAENYAI